MNLKCGEEVHFNSGITKVLPVFDKQEGEVDFN